MPRIPRTPRRAGTARSGGSERGSGGSSHVSSGIAAARQRFSQARAARESFYSANPTASSRRQARASGSSPRIAYTGGAKPQARVMVKAYRSNIGGAFENSTIEARFQAYKKRGGKFGPKAWYSKYWKTGKHRPVGQSLTLGPRQQQTLHGRSRKATSKSLGDIMLSAYHRPRYNAPADAVRYAEKYGKIYRVDPRLLLSIAKHETGFGSLGLGRRGLDLGYGAFDSGASYDWQGRENQYRAGAASLAKHGVRSLDDIARGAAAYWATDPSWERGVAAAYNSIGR